MGRGEGGYIIAYVLMCQAIELKHVEQGSGFVRVEGLDYLEYEGSRSKKDVLSGPSSLC